MAGAKVMEPLSQTSMLWQVDLQFFFSLIRELMLFLTLTWRAALKLLHIYEGEKVREGEWFQRTSARTMETVPSRLPK